MNAPIGLYFDALWYAEELYPLVFSVRAWGRLLAQAAPGLGAGSRQV